jgi:hypothetical protein
MKKKVLLISGLILLLVGLAGTFWGSSIAEAASGIWNSCPRGEVNDTYPGDCRSYIDTNKDSICDRSQSNPALKTTTASSSNSVSNLNASSSLGSVSTISGSAQVESTTATERPATTNSSRSYYFIPILAILVILYSLTWLLSNRKIINTIIHRKIWNTVLLIASAISVLLGLVLILNIDFNTTIVLPFNMLFWHVEAGIAFGIIALFHVFWHRRYFAKMLKVADQAVPNKIQETRTKIQDTNYK